jgi:hypothetical protein
MILLIGPSGSSCSGRRHPSLCPLYPLAGALRLLYEARKCLPVELSSDLLFGLIVGVADEMVPVLEADWY